MLKQLVTGNALINGILFQACWLACVVGSAYGFTWPAIIAFTALAAWQLQPVRRAHTDIRLVVVALAMGLIVDTLWIQTNLMVFTTQWPFAAFAPAWIIMLWLGFALTVNHSLTWLKLHPVIALAMGGIGGPLSYIAGLKLGAVEFLADTTLIMICLAVAWGGTMLLLIKLADPLPTPIREKDSG